MIHSYTKYKNLKPTKYKYHFRVFLYKNNFEGFHTYAALFCNYSGVLEKIDYTL